MSVPGWLSENSERAYPFIEREGMQEKLPDTVLLDAGFVVGTRSGFIPGTHHIWLSETNKISGGVSFRFRSDAPGLLHSVLEFHAPGDLAEFSLLEVDVESGDSSSSSSVFLSSREDNCGTEPLWEGWLVLGSVQPLLDLSDTLTHGVDEFIIEPCRIQCLTGHLLSTFNSANGDRTRATAAEGCQTAAALVPELVPFIDSQCVEGVLSLREGYNCTLFQNKLDNSITISAVKGSGAGEPCVEVPIFSGEEPPTGESLLSGGPSCRDVIGSINGVGGPRLMISAGSGVRVSAGPGDNEITVTVDLRGLRACPAEIPSSSSSSASSNSMEG